MKNRVLIVDDDADIVEILKLLLSEKNYEVADAGSARELWARFEGPQPDTVLLDWKLPDGDGIELLGAVKKEWPTTEVIMLTGHGNITAAVRAVKQGAYDFVTKPFEPALLLLLLERACEQKKSRERVARSNAATVGRGDEHLPACRSLAMQEVLRQVKHIAPDDSVVLITGEAGTGKSRIASLVHSLSPRAQGPFVKVNCAETARELLDIELFGLAKGMSVVREGRFQQAHGGTLFIDQVTEIPLGTQPRLTSVLRERTYCPIGGGSNFQTDCRVIASSNQLPEDALREHRLHPDLFLLLSAVSIYLPPLRERREDILPLAQACAERFAQQTGSSVRGFTAPAVEVLEHFDWPGNERQLENEIERAVLVSEGTQIDCPALSIQS